MKRLILALCLALLPTFAVAQAVIVPSSIPALTNGCVLQWVSSGSNWICASAPTAALPLPVSSSLDLLVDASSATKLLRVSLAGLSGTRTWTVGDVNLTFPATAGTLAILGANTFTGLQTANGGIAATTGTFSSTLGVTGNLTLSGTANAVGTITSGIWNAGAVTSSGLFTTQPTANDATYIANRANATDYGANIRLQTATASKWRIGLAPADTAFTVYNYAAGAAVFTLADTTGAATFAASIYAPVGAASAGNVSYSFTGDANTGMYHPAADTLGFVVGGDERFRITPGADIAIADSARIFLDGVAATGDTYIDAPAANTIRLRTGGSDGATFTSTMATFLGGVSATTGTFSGDFAVATTKFTVAAATGNTTIGGTLTMAGNAATYGLIGDGTNGLGIAATHASGAIRFYSGGTTLRAQINTNGTQTWAPYGAGTATFDASGNITSVSDERYKDRISALPYGLNEVLQLHPVQHGYNDLSGLEREHLYGGFLAQDVQAVMPLAVGTDARGYLTLADRPILGALVNAMKTEDARIAALEAEIAALKSDAIRGKFTPGYKGDNTITISVIAKEIR